MAAQPRRADSLVTAGGVVSDLDDVRDDLAAEQWDLDAVVAAMDDEQWHRSTPSAGWDVADQVGHLTFFDHAAARAITDPDAFQASVRDLFEGAVARGIDEYTLGDFRTLEPAAQLDAWRRGRVALHDAAATLRDDVRVAWYGPSMGATSFLTARLMEVWAHGIDVRDALGVAPHATSRLRHIAQLGFITRKWSYVVRGEEIPSGEVRLELTGPSGELWTWGSADALDTVRGSAQDFCLVVTQRRHVDDTTLETGALGRHWLLRAQAFAGGATSGPEPRGT